MGRYWGQEQFFIRGTGVMKSRNAVLNVERAPKAVSRIVFQSDIAEEHKESNLEAAFDCRLVSRPRNALSLDGIPGDSQRIVARPLDRVVPDYAGILPAAADPAPTREPRRKSITTVKCADLHVASSYHAGIEVGGQEQTVNWQFPAILRRGPGRVGRMAQQLPPQPTKEKQHVENHLQ